tara:strand:- start:102 stop:452 length:351 start_codon:yes stop_codon:yes gene_type:complete
MSENKLSPNIIEEASERNSLELKEMIDSVKNVVSHFVVDRASTRMIIRRIGYNGFTVVFSYFKPSGEWSVHGSEKTTDSTMFLIENFGVALANDAEYYLASKAYSRQTYGELEELR